jgi:hypothetical protein
MPPSSVCSHWATMCGNGKNGAGMFNILTAWIDGRRAVRRRWQTDARSLIGTDERGAYYAAQRFAAHNRVRGDRAEFWHWAKVASEVARLSPVAEMDRNVVESIIDEESRRFHARHNPDV